MRHRLRGEARHVVGRRYQIHLRILMRSGIGERGELKELGIKSLVDFPGVGRNLTDHVHGRSFRDAAGVGTP